MVIINYVETAKLQVHRMNRMVIREELSHSHRSNTQKTSCKSGHGLIDKHSEADKQTDTVILTAMLYTLLAESKNGGFVMLQKF